MVTFQFVALCKSTAIAYPECDCAAAGPSSYFVAAGASQSIAVYVRRLGPVTAVAVPKAQLWKISNGTMTLVGDATILLGTGNAWGGLASFSTGTEGANGCTYVVKVTGFAGPVEVRFDVL